MPHSGARQLTKFGRIELFGFSGTHEQQPLRGSPLRAVDQSQFQRFSGKFAAVEQLSCPKTFFGLALEDGDNQCVSLYLSQRLPLGCRFHQYDCAAKWPEFEILPILESSVLTFSRGD